MWTKSCSPDTAKQNTSTGKDEKPKWKCFNFLRLRRGNPHSPSVDGLIGDPGVVSQNDDIIVKIEVLTFTENLAQCRLCAAGQQLIEREELLFGEITAMDKTHEQEVHQLAIDRAVLLREIEDAIKASLKDMRIKNEELLRSAVIAVLQDEQQDSRWTQATHRTRPAWRPSNWRTRHDVTLRNLVQDRMNNTPICTDKASRSSVQTELCALGKQMKEDLLVVVEKVIPCYPPEVDICNVYAQLYHQAFRSRMETIADFVLDENDTAYVLRWMNDFYPNILVKNELFDAINYEALGKLLPAYICEALEEEYLCDKEVEVKTYLDRVLKETEKDWISGAQPISRNGFFFCPLAIDVIQLINAAVCEAQVVVGDGAVGVRCRHIGQVLLGCLEGFLLSLQKRQADAIRGNQINSRPFVMALLSCLEQFRDYIANKGNVFPEHMRGNCLTIVTAMTESGQTFLLGPLQKQLKRQYPAVGTSDWLKNSLFVELLHTVDAGVEDLRQLETPFFQRLVGQLHVDLTVEYIERLLKRNVKLKDSRMQEQAAGIVTQESHQLNSLFHKLGSKQVWVHSVLPRIAEVLRLQDLPSIQLEIVALGAEYPDLSGKHVAALLKLKSNLCSADQKKVKAVLDTLEETNHRTGQCFFSRVHVK